LTLASKSASIPQKPFGRFGVPDEDMKEALSVMIKVGRLPGMAKPTPGAIENALVRLLHETIPARELGPELGIPDDTPVHYEVKWLDEIVEEAGKIPLHVSIRGPKSIAGPLHDKLRAGLVEGRWKIISTHFDHLAAEMGIPSGVPTDFKFYVRSPDGEKFDV
jgi:hypothetical protein